MVTSVYGSFTPVAYVIITLIIVFNMVSCSHEPETPQLTAQNSNLALLDALKGNTETVVLGSIDGPQLIIVPDLSARVLGASIQGADDENLMWVDSTVLDGSIWKKKPYFWNSGGLRTWLAPEDLFFVNEQKDPESWFVPEQLDPAPFTLLGRTEKKAMFESDIELPANIGKSYDIRLRRSIELLTEPPSKLGSFKPGIEYVGIEKIHTLSNEGDLVIGEDLPYVCLWSLLQINPAGTTLVPLAEGADPKTAYREYFNPLGDRLMVQNGIISVKIDGKYRSKIGVRPEASGKGIAFLRDNGDGNGVLFLKTFPVKADGIYVDKPWGKPSDYGDAIELYNDDGTMGGFAELECHGPAKKLAKGDTQSHTLQFHMFRGPLDELKNIGSTLLDVDLSQAKYF